MGRRDELGSANDRANPSPAIGGIALTACIGARFDCADICDATGRILTRETATDAGMLRAALETRVAACLLRGHECETHAAHGMDHCRVCAGARRRRERACQELLADMAA